MSLFSRLEVTARRHSHSLLFRSSTHRYISAEASTSSCAPKVVNVQLSEFQVACAGSDSNCGARSLRVPTFLPCFRREPLFGSKWSNSSLHRTQTGALQYRERYTFSRRRFAPVSWIRWTANDPITGCSARRPAHRSRAVPASGCFDFRSSPSEPNNRCDTWLLYAFRRLARSEKADVAKRAN